MHERQVTSRLLARARSVSPLAFYLPGLVAGQMLAYWVGFYALAAAPLFLALLFCLPSRLGVFSKPLLLGALSGIASMLAIFPRYPAPQLDSQSSYLAQVASTPRYRRPGLEEFEMQLIGERQAVGEEAEAGDNVRLKIWDRRFSVVTRFKHLPWQNAAGLKRGDYFLVKQRCWPIERVTNPFSFQAKEFRAGIVAHCKARYVSRALGSAGESMRDRVYRYFVKNIREVLGPGERSGLLLSMSIGTRDVVTWETDKAFKATSLAHLVVVSGFQVTLIYGLCYWLSIKLLTRAGRLALIVPCATVASAFALLTALAFVVLVGVEGSSLRAALALLFVVAGLGLERRHGLGEGIVTSLTLLSLIWPGSYLEPGVQLTYAALGGILLASGKLGSRFFRYAYMCFVVALCTNFVICAWFGNLALLGPLYNIIFAVPLSTLGCQGTLLSLGAYLLGLDPGGWLLNCNAEIVGWLVAGVHRCASWGFLYFDLKHQPEARTIVCLLLLTAVARVSWRRLRSLSAEYNL